MASTSTLARSTEATTGAQPAKVLHVVNGEFYAGAERVQDLLALRLPQFGFEVGFACIKPNKFPAARQSQGCPLTELPIRGKWNLQSARDVARLVRQEGYSLIHAHTPRSLLVGRVAAALARVPLVYHIHSQTTTEVHPGWNCRLNAIMERLCLFGASAVIAVSASAQGFARRQRIADRLIRLVPNGIPVRKELVPHQPTVRGQQSDNKQEWTLGTVALFRPRKGLEILLEALSRLRGEGWPVRLRAVGPFETPEYEREVRQRSEQLGLQEVIDWPGFTTDVEAELERMDLFVFPSLLAEGMPMVVLESMAAGVPIVASRVDGVIDVLGDDADAGLLVPPGDAAALVKAILQVVRGERDWNKLRQTAARRQAEMFSDESMARGVAQVYREVLAQ
ncbi:MAG: glycosyltransferase [Pirellulales bacterium]